MINVNWFSDQVSFLETFSFCVSIPLEMNLSDMFDNVDKKIRKTPDYMLKSIICFVGGAHYLTFIKEYDQVKRRAEWLLYDDDKDIQAFESWQDVLDNMVQYGNLPTLLFYEKINKNNEPLRTAELTSVALRRVLEKAQELQ